MVLRPGLLLISGFLIAGCGFGQISFPGQYPPGQYPPGQYPPGQYPPGQGPYPQGGSSIPFPHRGRNNGNTSTAQNNQAPITTFTGMLRRISESNLVVESDDKRIVTISTANTTKYYKASGGDANPKDFQPGDHLRVDATEDDNSNFHATAVTQVKRGTAEERASASQPVDESPIASSGDRANGGNNDGDDGPPRLRRATGADDTPKAQITRGDSDRAESPAAPETPPAPEAPAAPDPGDPGPPVLRRGAPVQQASSSDAVPDAAPRPSLNAREVNGVTQIPPAPRIASASAASRGSVAAPSIPKSGDPVIDLAREAAFSFTETLPDYVVKQFTTRFQTDAAHGGQTSWQPIDNVTADVVSENGKESYKNILIDGKRPKEAVEKTGSWSTGEYASVLQDILLPQTDADFHGKRSSTIVNRSAFRYDFSVEQANSHWHVYASSESYRPEYSGAIWIDKENHRVLRIEMSAHNMPKGFPLDTVESAVDYDYVMIGGNKFLLPVHSESLSCERGTSICSRNVIDFRNYRKFGADTSIVFDPAPDKN